MHALVAALAFLTHYDLVFTENMLLSVAHEDSFKHSHASSNTFELAYHQNLDFLMMLQTKIGDMLKKFIRKCFQIMPQIYGNIQIQPSSRIGQLS
jgi:hypothetical protein